jgi:polysaccharide pyruvyl transferase WcaK-like protein
MARKPRGTKRSGISEALRVGLYGSIDGGNSGNVASTRSMLTYIQQQHPAAVVEVYKKPEPGISKLGPAAKLWAKLVDPLRIYRWVARHDVVFVPGVGALETTLPVHAWGFPFTIATFAAAGKISGVPVVLVSVGADQIAARAIRFLSNTTARLAAYRSFRDEYSKQAMAQRGVSVANDRVFPDLVFATPAPPYEPGDSHLVGVGVMDYHGGNDDRSRAAEIYAGYFEKMTTFVQWLLDNGYSVRLFGGDSMHDFAVADALLDKIVQQHGTPYPTGKISVERFSSYADLLEKMNRCAIVVATRYHNAVGALRLSKPTIAIGYSRKFGSLMDDMGMHAFIEYIADLDVERLILKFKEIEGRSGELSSELVKRNAANSASLAEQFSILSARFLERPGTPR